MLACSEGECKWKSGVEIGGGAMHPNDESVREVLKGLEGLEMLGQWQLALVQDLKVKAKALLESTRDHQPGDDSSGGGPA